MFSVKLLDVVDKCTKSYHLLEISAMNSVE